MNCESGRFTSIPYFVTIVISASASAASIVIALSMNRRFSVPQFLKMTFCVCFIGYSSSLGPQISDM